MPQRRWFQLILSAILVGLIVLAVFTREHWLPWVWPTAPQEARKDAHAPHGNEQRIKLSPQARKNLGLVVEPVELQGYWRLLQVPGVVVERRGKGDQGFVAPVTGVVKSLAAYPGDTVQLGGALLTLRLNSETLQTSQTELFKTAQDIRITRDQKTRADELAKAGGVAGVRSLELGYQIERLLATQRAYRADLAVKGLTPQQIDQAETGEFLKEIVVRVPTEIEGSKTQAVGANGTGDGKPLLEVEELKVYPGEQVQAGQLLGLLSNHQNLYAEGRGFREDTTLIEKAAAQGWALQTSFPEERAELREQPGASWPALTKPITILYLANTIDATSQTFPFFAPLPNQYREYQRGERTYRIWRFRPGQRVQLGVPVQEFKKVFVLPVGAVAREGAEVFVFQQNGDYFVRRLVHVLYEDASNVLVANDGSIFSGNYIARNAAEAINRALRASEKGESDPHAGHSH